MVNRLWNDRLSFLPPSVADASLLVGQIPLFYILPRRSKTEYLIPGQHQEAGFLPNILLFNFSISLSVHRRSMCALEQEVQQ